MTEAVGYLREQIGAATGLGFIDDPERTLASIAEVPGLGSPRFATELDLPGLPARRLVRFPYLVFSRFDTTDVDVWRILHTRRDIPERFRSGPPA